LLSVESICSEADLRNSFYSFDLLNEASIADIDGTKLVILEDNSEVKSGTERTFILD
jgi:hypothetical protein